MLCFLAANALTGLCICAGSSESSLLVISIHAHVSSTFSYVGPYIEPKYEKYHYYTCMLKFKLRLTSLSLKLSNSVHM